MITPGPWSFDYIGMIFGADNQLVADFVQRQADARLIALSPDLLEMLKEASNQIAYLHDKLGTTTGSGNSVLARINDLIEKVEGR